MPTISINGNELHLAKVTCEDGTNVISLYDDSEGYMEEYAELTVNSEDGAQRRLNPDEILVKTWSENESLIQPLLDSGYFVDTGKRVQCGFCQAHVWKVMKDIIDVEELYSEE